MGTWNRRQTPQCSWTCQAQHGPAERIDITYLLVCVNKCYWQTYASNVFVCRCVSGSQAYWHRTTSSLVRLVKSSSLSRPCTPSLLWPSPPQTALNNRAQTHTHLQTHTAQANLHFDTPAWHTHPSITIKQQMLCAMETRNNTQSLKQLSEYTVIQSLKGIKSPMDIMTPSTPSLSPQS